MKRIAFYTFYEKRGIVRDYVAYYLNALKEVAGTLCVIVNGELSDEGRDRLNAVGAKTLVRENSGFDFAAWKFGVEHFGRERLAQFDEIILCNCSCYGPVYPFSKVFEKMAAKECDFWGLFRHPEIRGVYPSHLQSYFLVIRRTMTQSEAFSEYWRHMTFAKDWHGAVRQETSFTPYFEERGFRSASFVPAGKYDAFIENPSILAPLELLCDDSFPLIKRKIFTENYRVFLELSRGVQAQNVLHFLKTNYSPLYSLILQDLIETQPESHLRRSLHLTFVLPDASSSKAPFREERMRGSESVALILFSYFEDLIEQNRRLIAMMPSSAEIFVTVVSEEMKILWEKEISSPALTDRHIEIRLQENRGRNETAYWLTCRDVVESHEILCVVHDKKSQHSSPFLRGAEFAAHCRENILKSADYVRNVLSVFRENPRIGILMPPLPIFAGWRNQIPQNEWGAENRKIAQEIYGKCSLSVPFDETPAAPFGTMFWLRGKTMVPFYRYPWDFQDFPEEPLRVKDGTVLHALERMYPMFAQEAGYLSGWILPASNAGVYFDNLYFDLYHEKWKSRVISSPSSTAVPIETIHFSDVKNTLRLYLRKKFRKLFRAR